MKPKNVELLKLLMDKPSNAKRLAEMLDVSVRSIKNYVKEINDEHGNIIQSSSLGYSLNQYEALEILKSEINGIPQSSHERVFYIIAKLLNSTDNPFLNVYDICEEIYISLSTLKKDFVSVKNKIAEFDLSLVTNGDQVAIEGLEKNKRKLLSSILYEESSINFISYESLQNAFEYIDIDFIKKTIISVFDRYQYFINDYSLINLVLHVAIAIDRINNQISDKATDLNGANIRLSEFNIAKEITNILSSKFSISYNSNEIKELGLLIASRATSLNYQDITKANIEEYVGGECMQLVYHLQKSINDYYHFDLLDEDFTVRFALHIRNLLIRSENNRFSKNPLTDNLKKTCPMLYEVSVKVASELKKQAGISINDDEISYFAFHIGSAIENTGSLKEKTKVVYYSPNYYDTQDRVINFIKKNFANDIVITSIITDEGQIDDIIKPDFILTSIPISKLTMIKVVHISILLNDLDKKIISDTVYDVQKKKKEAEFEYYLRTLIKPNLFEVNDSITDSYECISYMGNMLIDLKFANNDFVNEVIEREKMSSTCFSNAAIPHSMYMNAHKTGISLLISSNGIQWGNSKAYLVLMMCFNKLERKVFNDIFEPISMILSEKENLVQLLKAGTYEDFISVMIRLFSELNSY